MDMQHGPVHVHEQYMDVHVHLHVQKCTRFLHTFTHIYKYIYIVKFRFVSFRRIFGRNFAETKRNTELAKRNFGEISRNFAEISFRDETEKFYFGGTIVDSRLK